MKARIVIALVHQLLHFNRGIIVTLNNNHLVSDITDFIIRKWIHNSVTLLWHDKTDFFSYKEEI